MNGIQCGIEFLHHAWFTHAKLLTADCQFHNESQLCRIVLLSSFSSLTMRHLIPPTPCCGRHNVCLASFCKSPPGAVRSQCDRGSGGPGRPGGSESSAGHYNLVMFLILMAPQSIGQHQRWLGWGVRRALQDDSLFTGGRVEAQCCCRSADRWRSIVSVLIDRGWGQGVTPVFHTNRLGWEDAGGC